MLDFSRCRNVWIPDEDRWSPPPPHVKEGVRFILNHPYAMLGTAMGGMKSAQAMIAAQFLHDADIIDRVIVIAPASVAPKVWYDLDLGQLREQVFEDKRNIVSHYHAKIRQWVYGPEDAKPLRWIISHYEYIRSKRNLATLLKYCGPKTMLILDESSAVRSYDSQQTEACMTLRWQTNARGRPILGTPQCGRILEMNGTPIAESPLDLFSQGNLLHPSILDCRYISHYKARYAIQKDVLGAGGRPLSTVYGKAVQKIEGWTNLDDLQRRFAPYVLRREAKDLGIDFALPPVGFDVQLSSFEWKVYSEMKREMVAWLKSGVATAAQAGVKAIRLAQITSGFVGGVEDSGLDYQAGDLIDLPGSFLDGLELKQGGADALNAQAAYVRTASIEWIGRSKLDFTLEWHSGLMRKHPDLKLLMWVRFVDELRRLLAEERKAFPSVPIGAACGQAVLGGTQREEREQALRLLHPKTAPIGPATVGATQGTGAIGLNFTACRTVMDVSYDSSSFKKKQGDARVNRPGQTGPVSSFYLTAVGPKGQRTIDHHQLMTRLGKDNINAWTVSAWVKALMEE